MDTYQDTEENIHVESFIDIPKTSLFAHSRHVNLLFHGRGKVKWKYKAMYYERYSM